MPVANDYYGILGVRRDAGPDEIKKAYRRLARELGLTDNQVKSALQYAKELLRENLGR